MKEKIYAVRGAIAPVQNSEESIKKNAVELFEKMCEANDLKKNRIVSVIVGSTRDLTAYYPATALRLYGLKVPLMSCVEPDINGAMRGCIRIMITAAFTCKTPEIRHIYLGEAKSLRPDIKDKEENI